MLRLSSSVFAFVSLAISAPYAFAEDAVFDDGAFDDSRTIIVTGVSDGYLASNSVTATKTDTPLIDMNPNQQTNEHIRGRVIEAGLEISPVSDVADAAWKAVHGDTLHNRVGKSAHRLAFASRWIPGRLRKQVRSTLRPLGQ